MTTTPHLATADHRAELADAVIRLLARQLPVQPIAYVWPQPHRVAFRTAAGRTGDVVVLVNWDIAPTESTAAGINAT